MGGESDRYVLSAGWPETFLLDPPPSLPSPPLPGGTATTTGQSPMGYYMEPNSN